MKTLTYKPAYLKTRMNLGMDNVSRRFIHGLRIGEKTWNKKIVLKTAQAINGTWIGESNHSSILDAGSTSQISNTSSHKETARENTRIRKRYWDLIRELESISDEKAPTNNEVKRFLEVMIKKEYLGSKITYSDYRALESFERTARVVAVVAESLYHWDDQVSDYGDIRVLANYLYEHMWMPALALRIPVDMLTVMFDHHHESLQRDLH